MSTPKKMPYVPGPERVTLQVCPVCGRATFQQAQQVCTSARHRQQTVKVVPVEYARVR